MVPIDKAGNNIAFICKRFYATVLMKELGLGDQSTSTYTRIFNQTPDDIISMHQQQIKENFGDDIAKYENTTRHLLDSETTQKSSKISFYNSQ